MEAILTPHDANPTTDDYEHDHETITSALQAFMSSSGADHVFTEFVQGSQPTDAQDGQSQLEELDLDGEPLDPLPADYWDASELHVETYDDLAARRDEIVRLLILQADVPHLQEESEAATEKYLASKQASWAVLLRRSFTLYAASCKKLGIPPHPICGPKVALYLSRLDEEPPVQLDGGGSADTGNALAGPSGSTHDVLDDDPQADLPVSPSALPPLDPSLASPPPFSHLASDEPSKPAHGKGKKPKKVLKRKTLEQYVNRLTAIRTPTLPLWKSRGGAEWETGAGIGMSLVVRDLLRRADGESAVDVKKRGRQRGAGQGRPTKRTKKEHDVGTAMGSLEGEDLQVGGPPGDMIVDDDDDVDGDALVVDALLGSGQDSPPPHLPPAFLPSPGSSGLLSHSLSPPLPTASTSGSHPSRLIPTTTAPKQFNVTSGHSSFAVHSASSFLDPFPGPLARLAPTETFTLTPEAFQLAQSYIRSLQQHHQSNRGGGGGGTGSNLDLDQQTIGEIARSVEAAQAGTIPGTSFRTNGGAGADLSIDPALE